MFEARFLDKSGENDENIVVENESPESPEKPEEVRAENVPYEKCRWDFFLSHKQSNAQDAVQNLRLALSEHFLGASFWLDIEQDPTVRGMCYGVSHSRNVLIFLTEGITDSKFCRMEMRWALEANRNLILVKETDDRHGKPNMETLIERCPDDLKHIFSENVIIPWFRDPEFRAVSVEKILQRIAVDPRRTESTGRRSAKPLVYGKGGEGEDAEVFDRSFVIYSVMFGVVLPGAGSNTRRWAAAVRIIIFTCGVLCTTRLFTPEGPGFLDYATIIQAVTAHFMVFFQLHVMLDLLRSVEVQDLLENHIDCPKEGKKLKFKTKVLTAIVLLLTAVLSCWGWVGYLPGFWHPYYMASGNIFIAYGIAHGLAFLLILPIFFGSYFAILTIMFTLQELCNMAFLTAYNELNLVLEEEGLEAVALKGEGINVSEMDLYCFQVKYAKSWDLYKKIQRRTALPLFIFWAIQLLLLIWSVWSLAQGFGPNVSDWRLPQLKTYWTLVVRLSWWLGASPWFGVACWITALTPWCAVYYSWKMNQLSKRLIFKNPINRRELLTFLAKLPLEFRSGFIQATPRGLLLFLPMLVLNTLGFVAEATRLFASL